MFLWLFLFFWQFTSVSQNNTFQAILGGPDIDTYPHIIDAGDNEFIVIYRTNETSDYNSNVILAKLDSIGQIIWSKKIGDYQRNFSKNIYKTDYGYLLLLWRSHDYNIDDWHLIKVDHNGNVLEEHLFGGERDDQIYDLVPLNEYLSVVAINVREYYTNAGFAIIDDNFNISNYKTYAISGSNEITRSAIITSNNQVLYCGYTSADFKYLQPLILNTSLNGNLNYMYSFEIDGVTDFSDLIEISNNEYIAVGYTDGFGNNDFDLLIYKFQEDGSLIWMKTIGGKGDDKAFDVHLKSDGTILITGETSSENSSSDIFLININNDGELLSGHVYGGNGNEHFGFADITESNQVIIATETESYDSGSTNILIIKANEDGSSCCDRPISTFSVKNVNPQLVKLEPNVYNDYTYDNLFDIGNKSVDLNSKLVCYEPVKIIGRDGFCSSLEPEKYTIEPPLTYDFYKWVVPNTAEVVANQEDTTIFVNFNGQSGYLYLQSEYCEHKTFDSLFVNVTELLPKLGDDTIICPNSEIILTPGSDYVKYLWQDGSSNSFYTTSDPGLYWVRVDDTSGCQGVDSTQIMQFDIPKVDLGEEVIYFEGDYYLLDAGPGFTNYLWNDNSTGQSMRAYDEGTYWVQAFLNSCMASDTVSLLRKKCDILLPNIITPNSDGINDETFAINELPISNFELTIYDRRGLEIFTTDDVNFRWDGTMNGSILPSGLYVYHLNFQCEGSEAAKLKTGSILIIR